MSASNLPSVPRPPAAPVQATRPPAAPAQGTRPSTVAVAGAIRKASQSTGASFEYLLATAKVESDLNPNLTMQSSTATGLFQFLEQTWLGVMQSAGRAFGFGRYADAITQTKSGTYVVEDPALREEMMRLRKDPAVNAAMGGVFTQQNAAVVSKRIGRQPTDGELYVAHFFGPYAGSKVIGMAKSNPNANAAEMFPAAAVANRPIFYDKQGNARSVAGVYDELVRRYQVARSRPTPGLEPAVASVAAPAAAPGAPLALTPSGASIQRASTQRAPTQSVAAPAAPAAVRDTAGITAAFAAADVQPPRASIERTLPDPIIRPPTDPVAAVAPGAAQAPDPAFRPLTRSELTSVFHSLFETEGSRGPLSPAVAELWGAPAARARARDAPALPDPASPLPALPDETAAADAPLDLPRNARPGTRRPFNGRI